MSPTWTDPKSLTILKERKLSQSESHGLNYEAVFDIGLFKAAFIKMKNSAVVLFIICTVSALMPFLGYLSNPRPLYVDYSNVDISSYITTAPIYRSISSQIIISPLLWVLIFAPIFVAAVFLFLRRRADTDFYHSIGHSKTQIFVSFFSACIVQITAFCVFFFLFSYALWSIPLPQINITATDSLTPVFFLILILCFFLAAASLLAHTLTGRAFSCFIMALLIVTLPLYCGVFSVIIRDVVPNIPLPDSFLLYTNGDYVLIYFTEILPSLAIVLLTLVLPLGNVVTDPAATLLESVFCVDIVILSLFAVAFTVAAFFVYKNRRSELATKPFISSTVSGLVRIGFTLPFMMILTTRLIKAHSYVYGHVSYSARQNASLFVFILVFCLVSCFVISRKPKKTLISFCFTMVHCTCICAAVFLFTLILKPAVLSFEPTPQSVHSVWMECLDADTYEKELTEGVFSQDPRLIDIICNEVNNTNSIIEDSALDGSKIAVKVKLRLKNGLTVTRVCYRKIHDNLGTLELLLSAEPYASILTEGPTGDVCVVSLPCVKQYNRQLVFADYTSRLGDAFLRDYEKATPEEKAKSVLAKAGESAAYPIISFETDSDINSSFAILDSFEECNAVLRDYILSNEAYVQNRTAFQAEVMNTFFNPADQFIHNGKVCFIVAYEPELSLDTAKSNYSTENYTNAVYEVYRALANDKCFTGQKEPDESDVLIAMRIHFRYVFFYAERHTAEQIYSLLNVYYK